MFALLQKTAPFREGSLKKQKSHRDSKAAEVVKKEPPQEELPTQHLKQAVALPAPGQELLFVLIKAFGGELTPEGGIAYQTDALPAAR